MKALSCSIRQSCGAFSLLELLAVMAIISILSITTVPLLSSFVQAGGVNKAVSDLSSEIEAARSYAMANHTYLRMGFSYDNATPPNLVCVFFAPADGTLQNASSAQMADPTLWPMVTKAASFSNVQLSNTLNSQTPPTSGDSRLSDSTIGSVSGRVIQGNNLNIDQGFLQFLPDGEVSLGPSAPFRFVSIGLKTRTSSRDEALLRVSGSTGAVQILRSEDGVQ